MLMKVIILTDMEGSAGIISWDEFCGLQGRYFEIGRKLTTLEVYAAIEGLLDAGAKEIVVVGCHYRVIDPALLHPAANLLDGRPLNYPYGCDKSFDAAVIVGQHAKSNTDGGHLCHTEGFGCEDQSINGISVGEIGCFFLSCAYFGVPTVMLSGDQAACDEARALVPNIEVAPVKWGLKRGSAEGLTAEKNKLFNGAALHLHPERARVLIREKAKLGLGRRDEIKPFWVEPPYELISKSRPSEDGKPGEVAVRKGKDLLELLSGLRWQQYALRGG